jgi:HAD superfamily hydrolase (TIGR01544 family)
MNKNVLIPNPEKLEQIKKGFAQGGTKKIHVLADFDRTLTTAFVDGKSIPSLISVLRDGNYLTPDYAEKANALYAKYHPIEIDPKIPLSEKKKAMLEWWKTHFALLVKCGLSKSDLEKVVVSDKVKFRKGAKEFIEFLKEKNIPLVIMSSSGLGGDAIRMYLEKAKMLSDNIHVVSNTFEWDENGNAIRMMEPIIHVLNKDETAIQDFPVFKIIEDRKNVLLLGDSLGDVGMVEGFDYENLLKIGFLNEKIEESIKDYEKNFDIVILHDFDMNFVNELLEEIAGS